LESAYIFIVGIILILAVSDLIVGVSNDAVNFLNSAIGSKVISFKNIMILASLGVAIGALSSSGMMEIARKGIFNPEAFYFNDIIIIFLSVMITDILILDLFNSWGLPTSTTVSIVFELLGAAVVMSLIKILTSGSDLNEIENYINIQKASEIVLGILLSVFIAFSIGALIQWLSRLILTFDFESKSISLNSVFGSISFTTIINFILIKGIKGTPYSDKTYPLFNDLTINQFIDSNILIFWISSLIFWFIVSFTLIRYFKIDIYKIIIGIGTFSLALAFAGNDLVNFIGVPIAALESFQTWSNSAISATEFSMVSLSEKVNTKPIYLLISGIIMVLTLWFSSKAKNVVKTSLDLSNQNKIDEKFSSNFIGKFLVSIGIAFNSIIIKYLPQSILKKIEKSFEYKDNFNVHNSIDDKKPSFDKLRACLNLVIAAILISIATSYKLPLSTTYVTFMVAMGTSLSDRAWSNESAIYRVSGVVNVIGGWFLTAFSAFTICGVIVLIIYNTDIIGVVFTLIIVGFLLVRNHLNFKKKGEIEI
jgi:phosphate/sulfate permease